MNLKAGIVLAVLIAAGVTTYLALMIQPPERALPLPAASLAETLAQQATPAPAPRTREPLDGDSFLVSHVSVLLPGGIISEESQSMLWELEGTFNGTRLPHPHRLEYRYEISERYNSPVIHVVQEVFFPREAYVRVLGLVGGPQYIPPVGVTPEPFDFSFPLDMPFGANSARIIYGGEWAWLSKYIGRFRVGEEQTDVFWFLYQQLGWERAIIANSETYEGYWGSKRTQWANDPYPTFTSPDLGAAKPPLTSLPPTPETDHPPLTPPVTYIPIREDE